MLRIHDGRIVASLFVLIAIAAAAGCSGRSTTSVTAPTGATAAAQPGPAAVPSGATISGTVVGVSSTAAAGSRLTAQGVSISVTVTGSPVASTVDANGHFTLENVPTGHIDLHFSGPGIDAHLGLDDVVEHATITITVRVTAAGAQLEDAHGSPNNGPAPAVQAEVNGTIAAGSLAGSCTAGTLTFMVGTTKVVTNAATHFQDGGCARLQAGLRVEVKGTRQADNSVLATNVESAAAGNDDDGEDQHEAEVKGAIAAGSLTGSCAANTLAFKVGTTTVKTNATTQFKDTTCAALKAGDSVEAKGTKQADASVLASRVEKKK
jgi:hypothetical protein